MMPFPDPAVSRTGKSLAQATPEKRLLCFHDSYICPVCRHGQITELTLMDAFACNFCRHIFTANLTAQSVQMVDSSQPMAWRWTGWTWQSAYQQDGNLTSVLWVVGVVLVVLPAGLVWLSSHTFPPLPGSRGAWFPTVWLCCTFFTHLSLVIWLTVEYCQFPLYVAGKVRLRRLLERS